MKDQTVSFKPEDGQQGPTMTQNMGALAVPCHYWSGNKMTEVVWQTRWTVNGLTPVRPVVVWAIDYTLDSHKCLVLE